jgi:hypothetical protein
VQHWLMYCPPSPEVLKILPLRESPTEVRYTPPVAWEPGGSSLSPIKASRHGRQSKRKRADSTTPTLHQKVDLIHRSPSQTLAQSSLEHVPSVSRIQQETLADNLPDNQSQYYSAYLDYVLADCAGFYQISERLCVVQGWDGRRQRITVIRRVMLTCGLKLTIDT